MMRGFRPGFGPDYCGDADAGDAHAFDGVYCAAQSGDQEAYRGVRFERGLFGICLFAGDRGRSLFRMGRIKMCW